MKNQMKKLGTIETVQDRIATGHWKDDKTRFIVINSGEVYQDSPRAVTVQQYKDEGWDLFQVVGYYDVIHSSILAGTWADFVSDVNRIINRRLVADGHAKRADSYSNFAAMGLTGEPVLN